MTLFVVVVVVVVVDVVVDVNVDVNVNVDAVADVNGRWSSELPFTFTITSTPTPTLGCERCSTWNIATLLLVGPGCRNGRGQFDQPGLLEQFGHRGRRIVLLSG